MNLMNGNIKVDSTLHKGTRITVTIYLELQEKEKEQDENLMNLPVLVVDDDKTCCESTVATLKEIGITGEWGKSRKAAASRGRKDRENCKQLSIVFHAFYRICIRRLPTLEDYRQEGDQEAETTLSLIHIYPRTARRTVAGCGDLTHL